MKASKEVSRLVKKYPEFFRGIKPTPERILGFPYVNSNILYGEEASDSDTC